MPVATWGSQRKRNVPARASFTFHVCVPVYVSGVVRRLKPGAMTWASWMRPRSRTTTVYVPVLIDLTVFPAAVFNVIVNPGPDVRRSFVLAVTGAPPPLVPPPPPPAPPPGGGFVVGGVPA